jgi:uncharacterized MnhB-related membrane protein
VGSRSRARARAQASQPSPRPASATLRSTESAGPVSPNQPELRELPRTVLAAAVVEAIEAAGILVAAILAGIATATGHSYQTASGVAITLIGVGAAIVVAFVAHGLRRARRWSRTPAVLTQLFGGVVAVYLLQAGRLEWGVPGIVLAAAGMAALLSPASVKLLTPGRIEKS